MTFPDITPEVRAAMPKLRGRLLAHQELAPFTWFRVGGAAQALFTPEDEEDLGYFLAHLDTRIAVSVIGLGSNLIVRDGGVSGVVVRLARGFADIAVEEGARIRAGAAVPDIKLSRAAADAGIDGLAFYRGIPGTVGGALRMNAGAHGGETRDRLIAARAIDRAGRSHALTNADMKFAYRHCGAPPDFIFTEATYQGVPGEPENILAEMERVTRTREAAQPIREKTGGSTFKNPPHGKAWQLIDAAGCRGLRVGGAQVSSMHCNFLINTGNASAHDIEALGETVRARVKEHSGVELHWEIKRIGVA